MNDESSIRNAFQPLFDEVNDFSYLLSKRPFLAHYTSIITLEKIMANDELWFSNPLFMNDLEEMRFGMNEGLRLFEQSDALVKAAGTAKRVDALRKAYMHYYNEFGNKHALDVYVFCLSEHDPEKTDGLLSMWRGYGGQGTGAALIFNTNFIIEESKDSPLRVAKVRYGTAEERVDYLARKLEQWCATLSAMNIPDDKLYIAAWSFFCFVKFYALISKHKGFYEENEWRIMYSLGDDPDGLLKSNLSYIVGSNGVEPKFKFKIQPLPLDPSGSWSFSDILERIILGPTASTPLAQLSIKRMLENVDKAEFCSKVHPSSIPLRLPNR